jgi:PhnB protein
MARATKKPAPKAAKKKMTVAKKTKKTSVKKVAAKRKTKKVSAIPKGYATVTPYLILNEAAKAIEFYKKAFGAKERARMEHSNGKIGHAELKFGDSIIMLADECPEKGATSPANGGSGVSIHLYVKDVDTVFKKAVSSGAKIIREVENMFYGDRSGGLQDPFGHTWFLATHVEDVTPAKIKKRAAELYGNK